MQELQAFIDTVDKLVNNLSPQQRRVMLRTMSIELRRRNAQRVKANIEPSGDKMSSRNGDRWKMRGLRDGQTLRRSQKFNFFKERDLSLHFVRDNGTTIVGREQGVGNPPFKASGFVRANIYYKASTGKQQKMFTKMAKTKYLRSRSNANEAVVGFLGGLTAKIAAEHHYGSSSKNLPARELIGLSAEDLEYAQTEILAAIAKGI